MSTPGLVDVVIPVFNGERFLAQAIESALAQTHLRTSVTVVDDGSNDASGRIAGRYPIRYMYQVNQGVAAACNAGADLGEGEFIAFLGADDLWLPQKLERQMSALCAHPECGYALCHVRNFLDEGARSWLPPDEIDAEIASNGSGTWLLRREAFDRVGRLDTSYRVSEDLEWLTRATALGVSGCNVAEVLVLRRIHEGNLTRDAGLLKAAVLRILRESVARRRDREGTRP